MKAYWFSSNGEAKYGTVKDYLIGQTYKVEGEIKPCSHGLHASVYPFDALGYAGRGRTLDIVELGGTVVSGNPDKHAASERTHVQRIDATDMLQEFARWCALSVAYQWPEMPAIIRQYLETGDRELRNEAATCHNTIMDSCDYGTQSSLRASDATYYAFYDIGLAALGAEYAAQSAFDGEVEFYRNAHDVDDPDYDSNFRDKIRQKQRDKFQELADKYFAQALTYANPDQV